MKTSLTATALLIAASPVAAQTTFVENFDNFDLSTLLIDGSPTTIASIVDGQLALDLTGTTSTDVLFPVTGLTFAPGTRVEVSTDVVPTGQLDGLERFGLDLFGILGTAPQAESFYSFFVREPGGFGGGLDTTLNFQEVGGDEDFVEQPNPSIIGDFGTAASLNVDLLIGGTEAAPSIAGTFTVTANGVTDSLAFADTSIVGFGDLFGFFVNGASGAANGVLIDNLTITTTPIPEPASAALLAAGGALLLTRRRVG